MEYVNDLRMVMRRWVSGVVIVTSAYEGQRHGMTVDSFNSVSIVPPLVTFTLNNNTRTHALVRQSGWVGITMLHAGQIDLSDRFAGRFGDGDRFAGLDTFTMQSGVPFSSRRYGIPGSESDSSARNAHINPFHRRSDRHGQGKRYGADGVFRPRLPQDR